jgi:hypothetical protein
MKVFSARLKCLRENPVVPGGLGSFYHSPSAEALGFLIFVITDRDE